MMKKSDNMYGFWILLLINMKKLGFRHAYRWNPGN